MVPDTDWGKVFAQLKKPTYLQKNPKSVITNWGGQNKQYCLKFPKTHVIITNCILGLHRNPSMAIEENPMDGRNRKGKKNINIR